MTIIVTFIRERSHFRVVFGRKKPSSVKIGPQNVGFWKI